MVVDRFPRPRLQLAAASGSTGSLPSATGNLRRRQKLVGEALGAWLDAGRHTRLGNLDGGRGVPMVTFVPNIQGRP